MNYADLMHVPEIAQLKPEFEASGQDFDASLSHAYDWVVYSGVKVDRSLIIKTVTTILKKMLVEHKPKKPTLLQMILRDPKCWYNAVKVVFFSKKKA